MAKRKIPSERIAEIVHISKVLFQQRGYEQVRVDDIINSANISKGGFYHHFSSKDEVLILLVKQEIKVLIESIDQAVDKQDPVSALIIMLSIGSSYLEGEIGILESLSTFTSRSLYIEIVEQEFAHHLKPIIISILEQGMKIQLFNPIEPMATAEIFLAVNNYGNRQTILEKWSTEEEASYNKAALAILGVYLGVAGQLEDLRNQLVRKIQESDHDH